MVKVTAPPPAWQRHEMRVSADLERAAYRAGVAMPAPVEPVGGSIGYWAPVDDRWVRVSRWVDGVPPDDDAALAPWLGRTLAAIERLDLPGDPTAEAAYPLHDPAEWRDWLDEAVAAGVLDRSSTVDSAVREGVDLVRAALATRPAFRLAHRDVNRRNVLVTAHGPVLLDFDYAGPEVPWWEVVHHAFDLPSPPQPALVGAVLAAHRDAGGAPGPAGTGAFAGLVRAALNSLAYHLWLATGQRPAHPDRRLAAAALVRDRAATLPAMLSSLDRWSRLLR